MRLKTQVARLEKLLGAGDDDQRHQEEFDACHVVISEDFDAFAKQVPGASLQSEEFQSAINRFCEIAVGMGPLHIAGDRTGGREVGCVTGEVQV